MNMGELIKMNMGVMRITTIIRDQEMMKKILTKKVLKEDYKERMTFLFSKKFSFLVSLKQKRLKSLLYRNRQK
jgi:hypothetical protein